MVMESCLMMSCVRTPSKIHPQARLNYITGSALLTNGCKIIFYSHKIQGPLIPYFRHAVLGRHGEISHEDLCMYLPESFRMQTLIPQQDQDGNGVITFDEVRRCLPLIRAFKAYVYTV
jgi:hypothetical protein